MNCQELFDQMQYVMKTKKNDDVINRIGAFYVKNDIELLWSIGSSATYDKNQTRQRCDRSYRCGLCFHDIELSWPIELGVIINDNRIG